MLSLICFDTLFGTKKIEDTLFISIWWKSNAKNHIKSI